MDYNFDLVEVLDPSTITMTLFPKDFVNEYVPAYGESWNTARNILLNSPADRAIIQQLAIQYKREHKFKDLPKVSLPECDLEDRIESPAQVANGMHRITVLRGMVKPIEFKFYYPPLKEEDNYYTEVELIFEEDIPEDAHDEMFGWLRSMPLENGEWVETLFASQVDNRTTLYLDKIVDHKLILKKLHSLAMLDEFSQFGLLEIRVSDEYDDEEE